MTFSLSAFSRRSFLGVMAAAMISVVSLSAPALSADAKVGSPASAFVEGLGNEALSSLTIKDIPTAERERRVRALLRKNFDLQTISRFAMGTYWKTATEAEKKEYQALFEDMIVKTYARRFEEYSGQQFKVAGALKVDEKDSIVSSQILQQDGPPVNVEWRVRAKNGQIKVVDVIVESISMSVTQRSDFGAVIQRGGGKVEALLASLRDRKADEKTAEN